MDNKHFTVTTYVVDNDKVLLLFHPKHHKWIPPGGHLEANEIPTLGAKREVLEETGLHVEFIRQENVWYDFGHAASFERPYLCLLENIPPHGDKPAHQHIDLIYLARPTGGQLQGGAKWFTWTEVEKFIEGQDIFHDVKQTIYHLLHEK